MPEWRVAGNLDEANRILEEVMQRVGASGVEKIAAEASAAMAKASSEAFARKQDPRTGASWVPASEATLRDKHFRSLLHRTGELEHDVVSGYALVPIGARAFVNVQTTSIRKAAITTYGVEAKARRSYTRTTRRGFKQESRLRKRPTQVQPARRFIGLPQTTVNELIDHAKEILTGGLS